MTGFPRDSGPVARPIEQDIFAAMRVRVLSALRKILPDLPDDIAARVEVTPPREASHGDMTTNAALLCAKFSGKKPQDIANALITAIGLIDLQGISGFAVAGPGFINIRLEPHALRSVLPAILLAGEAYGDSLLGAVNG